MNQRLTGLIKKSTLSFLVIFGLAMGPAMSQDTAKTAAPPAAAAPAGGGDVVAGEVIFKANYSECC